MTKMVEGETKRTDLPWEHTLVETVQFGMHTIAVEKFGLEKAKVWVRDFTSWDSAFETVMDKAGI